VFPSLRHFLLMMSASLNLAGDSDQRYESQSARRSEQGKCKATAILEVSKMHDLPPIESRILNQGLSLKRGLGAWHDMH
jgi:hypothetical protein